VKGNEIIGSSELTCYQLPSATCVLCACMHVVVYMGAPVVPSEVVIQWGAPSLSSQRKLLVLRGD